MIDVVAAIIQDNGCYLACRRRPERGGMWEFPGGKVEPGETANKALAREIGEELDVDIAGVSHFITVESTGDNLRLIFMHARLVYTRPTTSTDHDRLLWLQPHQLASVEWAPADRIAVDLLVGLHNSKPVLAPIGKDDAELLNEVD